MTPAIVLPLCGLSTRFKTKRPKWMLTHPDGRLMVEHALEGFEGPIYAAVRVEHEGEFDAVEVLEKCFGERVQVINLHDEECETHSQTVKNIIEAFDLQETPIIVRDCDNKVSFGGVPITNNQGDFMMVSEPREGHDDSNKGWVRKGDNPCFSVGVYGFKKGQDFLNRYDYNKSLIEHVAKTRVLAFVTDYKDWGTQEEWDKECAKYKTYFIDLDGVVFKNASKYFEPYWEDSELLVDNVEWVRRLPKESTIIFITARPTTLHDETMKQLGRIFPERTFILFSGLPHSQRVIINDQSPNANTPACVAINTGRNKPIENYCDC